MDNKRRRDRYEVRAWEAAVKGRHFVREALRPGIQLRGGCRGMERSERCQVADARREEGGFRITTPADIPEYGCTRCGPRTP